MIRYACTECGAVLESPSSLVGQQDTCPVCGQVSTVPQARSGLRTVLLMGSVGGVLLLAVAITLAWYFHSGMRRRPSPTSAIDSSLAREAKTEAATRKERSPASAIGVSYREQAQRPGVSVRPPHEPGARSPQAKTEQQGATAASPARPVVAQKRRPQRGRRLARSDVAVPTAGEPKAVALSKRVPRFVEPPVKCSSPCWSPDGRDVLFIARPLLPRGKLGLLVPGNVWVASADGSKRRLVTNFFFAGFPPPEGRRPNPLKLDVLAASWSPDGKRIVLQAFEGEHRPIGCKSNLYIMNANGNNIYQLVKGVNGGLPRWSPDGKAVIFEHGGSVVGNLDGTSFASLGLRKKGMFGEMKMFETIPNIREGLGNDAPRLYLEHACMSRDGQILAVGYEPAKGPPGAPHRKPEHPSGICVIDRNWKHIRWAVKAPIQQVFSMGWSSDRKKVAIDCADYHPYIRELFIFDIPSGKEQRLVEGSNPSWSPNGKRIAFEGGGGGGGGDIYVIDPDRKNLQRITNLTSPGIYMVWGSNPRWSPDGKHIVFRRGPYVSTVQPAGVYPRGQYIWTAEPDGARQTRVVRAGDYSRVDNRGVRRGPFEYTPCWRPDGSIVFPTYKERVAWGPTMVNPLARGKVGGQPQFELSVVSPDGSQVRRLMVLNSPAEGNEVSWSSDGSMMVLDKSANIWVAKGDGTSQKRLAGGSRPRWSPKGRRIVFVQGSKGNRTLCVMAADGSNQTQITEPGHGYVGYHSWCPDGKKIAFEGNYGIYVVSVHGGDARRVVPGVHQPCWSPDGKKMAFFVDGRPVELDAPGVPGRCICVMNEDGTDIRPVFEIAKTEYGGNKVANLSWSPDGAKLLVEEIAVHSSGYGQQHQIWIIDVTQPVCYTAPADAVSIPSQSPQRPGRRPSKRRPS